MKKVGWVKLSSKKYGGVTYEEEAIKCLSADFDVELVQIKSNIFKKGYLRAPEALFNLFFLKGEKDIWVRDNNTVIGLPFSRTKGKNMAMIHHIDFSLTPFYLKPVDFLMEKMMYCGLKKADYIVTVSEYWRNYFLKKGHENVFKIYNAFNVKEYYFSEKEIEDFKKENNLLGKPVIYLGNCQKAKGVLESYEALRGIDAHLVTSGEPFVKTPARNFKVSFKDYLKLLAASDVVLAMSKFKEGWCRVAHEAMLLKTPVVGSGKGGMKELLEEGGQVICPEFKELRGKVEYLLNNPEKGKEIGQKGYDFAKQFTLERFKADWVSLMRQLTD